MCALKTQPLVRYIPKTYIISSLTQSPNLLRPSPLDMHLVIFFLSLLLPRIVLASPLNYKASNTTDASFVVGRAVCNRRSVFPALESCRAALGVFTQLGAKCRSRSNCRFAHGFLPSPGTIRMPQKTSSYGCILKVDINNPILITNFDAVLLAGDRLWKECANNGYHRDGGEIKIVTFEGIMTMKMSRPGMNAPCLAS